MNTNNALENVKTVDEITAELNALVNEQETRINTQALRISMSHPFFSSLLLGMVRRPSWQVPTMSTNGLSIYWNPLFTKSLKDEEIRGVLVHECLHPGLGHLWRTKKEWDQRIANMAADFAINNFIDDYNNGLQDSGRRLALPQGGCLDHKYDGMPMEQIYTLLINDPQVRKSAEKFFSVGEMMQPGEGEDSGNGDSDDSESGGQGVKGMRPVDGRDQAEWARRMHQAANIAKAMGNMPSSLSRILGDLGKPDVNWADALSRFVEQNAADDFDWQVADRRFLDAGFYLPSMRSDSMPPITAVLDTSGSIDTGILTKFATELQDIMTRLRPEKLYVVYADAAVAGSQEFLSGDTISLNPRGGGGTDFRPAFDYVAKNHPDSSAMIYFTDGYGSFPAKEPQFPLLWITYGLPPREYPFGEVIEATL